MSERSQKTASALALLLAALCGLALVWTWPAGPLSETEALAAKALTAIGVLAVLATTCLAPLRDRPRAAVAVAVLAAAIATLAYTNYGRFHEPRFVHLWEHFHYQLGSKYFPELGYDGLYAASIAAQFETAPSRMLQPTFRDLTTNRVRPTRDQFAATREVRSRFEPDRWQAFLADHRTFLRALPLPVLADIRRDHGYNPTPAWTFVARLLNAQVPLTPASLTALAAVDALLLAAMFGGVFRVFGWKRGCAAVVAFTLGYAASFKWVGGAYLRLDWLAALGAGLCLVERRHPFLAGSMFGYAAAVRLFPAAFLIGPAILGLRALWRRESPREPLRLAAGFIVAVAVAVGAGSLTGRGFDAWQELAQRMQVYQVSWARNAVGIEPVLLYGGETLSRATRAPENWTLQREEIAAERHEKRWPIRTAQAALLLLLGLAAWSSRPSEAAALGMVAVFALTPSAGYYWGMLLLACLTRRPRDIAALLLLDLALNGISIFQTDNQVRFGLMSWGLLGLFAFWLIPDAWRTLHSGAGRASEIPERL